MEKIKLFTSVVLTFVMLVTNVVSIYAADASGNNTNPVDIIECEKTSDGANIVIDSGTVGGIKWTWDMDASDGYCDRLLISGTGPIPDFDTDNIAPWLKCCETIRKIEISEGITTIGNYSFLGFKNVNKILLPTTLSKIGLGAFSYLSSNILNPPNIELPNGLEEIGFGAFLGSGVSGFLFPNTLLNIDDCAFMSCGNLKTVMIPSSVKTIGAACFSDCNNLKDIYFESNKTQLGSISVSQSSLIHAQRGSEAQWYSIANEYNNFVSTGKAEDVVIHSVVSGNGTIEPSGAKWYKAGDNAEYTIKSESDDYILSELKLDGNVMGEASLNEIKRTNKFVLNNLQDAHHIKATFTRQDEAPEEKEKNTKDNADGTCGPYAYWRFVDDTIYIYGEGATYDYSSSIYQPWYSIRSSIKKIVIEDGITKIGKFLFSYIKAEEIELGNTLEIIELGAFQKSSITTLHAPKTLKKIGTSAFSECSALNEILFESGVEEIGARAFEKCISLRKVIFPEGTKIIGSSLGSSFKGCSLLSEVWLPVSLQKCNKSDFEDCSAQLIFYIPSSMKLYTYEYVTKNGYNYKFYDVKIDEEEEAEVTDGYSIQTALPVKFDSVYSKSWDKDTDTKPFYSSFSLSEAGLITIKALRPLDSEGKQGSLTIKVLDSEGSAVFDISSSKSNKVVSEYTYYCGLDKGDYYLSITPGFTVTKGLITTNFSVGFTEGYYEKENNSSLPKANILELNNKCIGYQESNVLDEDHFKFEADGKCVFCFENLQLFEKYDVIITKPDGRRLYPVDDAKYDANIDMYTLSLKGITGECSVEVDYYDSKESKQIQYAIEIVNKKSDKEKKDTTIDTYSAKSIVVSGTPANKASIVCSTDGIGYLLTASASTVSGGSVPINWLASSGHVIDVQEQEDGSVKVTPVGPGTAFVTAQAGTKTKSIKYTVKQHVKKLEASANDITLNPKEKYRICVTPDAPTSDKFFYESSNKSVCTVDGKGVVKAKNVGSAEIIIYAGEKKNNKKQVSIVKVTVNEGVAPEAVVKDVSVNYLGNRELYVGELGYISTLINNGSNNGGLPVKYSFDNKGVVKIDGFGHVTAKKAGMVKVTATCGGRSESITLTVKQPLKLYKVNKSYVQVAPKEGAAAKKVSFSVKTDPKIKKFIEGGGAVSWSLATEGTKVSEMSDYNGKAVFEVPYGADDTVVTAVITDPVTMKTYKTSCLIDVK